MRRKFIKIIKIRKINVILIFEFSITIIDKQNNIKKL